MDLAMEDYRQANHEERQRIRKYIQKHYSPANKDDLLPFQEFLDYSDLKTAFLDTLFAENTRFYFNKTAEETQKSIQNKDRRHVPAVIGMDNQQVAILWFNF